MSYNTLYPPIPLSLLRETTQNHPDRQSIDEWFSVKQIIQPRPQFNKCISICLFKQCVDNKTQNEHEVNSEKWHDKYYVKCKKLIADFNQSWLYHSNEWKIRLYLENQLGNLLPEFSSLSDRMEIYYMNNNSIGAQPGMLWRLLSFDDKTLEIAFSTDVDDELCGKFDKLRTFQNHNKTLGRYISYSGDTFKIATSEENSPLNYATVIGCMIAFRPQKSDINVRETITNYILYRMMRAETAVKPWEEYDDVNTERFCTPIGGHIYGWGGHWTMYGFDERIFKHTIFPHFTERGEVLTWMCEDTSNYAKLADDHPCKIDYKYSMGFRGNTFVRL